MNPPDFLFLLFCGTVKTVPYGFDFLDQHETLGLSF